jgi:DNA mismatch repair protein MutL
MEQPPKLPGLQPVGQAHGTYILAQDEDAIYLIDQHAAHERIHYEKFYRMFSQASPVVQPLLVPLPFEMPADEYAWFIGLLPQLEAVGIVIEPFGPNSFVVRAHPEWFPPERAGELAREVIDWMIQQKKSFHLSRLRDYAAKMCACKASIRANDRITLAGAREEIPTSDC